ncbi:MAG: hypothetical protein HRU06_16750 [Oceanospirillaceae bacterium]|nr:hypothetical protein [Oceanospirillaceae bacterium]
MNDIEQNLKLIPELADQIDLFRASAFEEDWLAQEHREIVAWATATACQNIKIINYVKEQLGPLSPAQKKIILTASSRMAITNPYFMSRNIYPLQAGGSLKDLAMRPFHELNIKDSIAYHYACIAISLINNGFMCFNSHLSSLKSEEQSDKAIDQALRLVSAVASMKQNIFNEQAFN